MRKVFFAYCLVLVLIFSTGCKSGKITERDPASIDPFMIENPVGAMLDDIYGLETELTEGKIVYAHKYYDPAEEVLTYDLLYDQSGGIENFIQNTEKHFSISLSEGSDKVYTGTEGQFELEVRFYEDNSVLLTVKVSKVYNTVIFLYMDNEYPDQLTPDYPEDLNIFAAIRGLEYDSKTNTLSFERFWRVDNEFATLFIDHYEKIYENAYEKTTDDTKNTTSVITKANDYVSLIMSSKSMDENESEISLIIRYDLTNTPKGNK